MAGKGDSPRPVNRERYDNNYDEIKWNVGSESDCSRCSVSCQYFERTGLVCYPQPVQPESQSVCVRDQGKKDDQDTG